MGRWARRWKRSAISSSVMATSAGMSIRSLDGPRAYLSTNANRPTRLRVTAARQGAPGASGRTSRIRRGGLPTRCRFGHGLSTRQRPQPPTRPETVTSIAGERVGASRIGEVSQRPFVTRSNHLSQGAFHRPTCQRLSGEADMRVTRVASMAVAAVVVACVADETTRSQAAAIGSGLIQATLQLPLG
jgi:hypothetical protein